MAEVTQSMADTAGTLWMTATQHHAQTQMDLTDKLKKSFSEPLLDHQAVPARHNPHPNEAAANRWPKPGWNTGGIIDPKDMRRHASDFGYRALRFKPQWKEKETTILEMTLDEVRLFLTKRYGSLSKAFDAMDFFRDGSLSSVEWREGIYNAMATSLGMDFAKYRSMTLVPRITFNQRAQDFFSEMDHNNDGLVQFDEFTKPMLPVEESGHDFSRRRNMELAAYAAEKQALLQQRLKTGSQERGSVADLDIDDSEYATTLRPSSPRSLEEEKIDKLKDFAVYLLKKFKDINLAFDALDIDGNCQLSMEEFRKGARRIKYQGDAAKIFGFLDQSNTGTISKMELKYLRQLPAQSRGGTYQMTKKSIQSTAAMRSPIKSPPMHQAGLSLAASDIKRPLGEHMRTAADFHTFKRVPTGRLDTLAHPNEYPGTDPANFTAECGPGFVDKGPEYFPFIGQMDHPVRGTKWNFGATVNRSKRFGPMMPSKQGNRDRDFSATGYLTYEGLRPQDGFKVCNTGGISWARCPGRPGISTLR